MPTLYEAQLRHARRFSKVLMAARECYLQGGEQVSAALAQFDQAWGQIRHGQAWTAAHAESDETAARLCSEYADGADSLVVKLGVQRKRQEDYAGAEETYHRAIQLDPTDTHAFYALAKVYYLMGEQKKSIVNYLRAAHLSVHYSAHMLPTILGAIMEKQLRQVPTEIVSELKQIHRLAPFLLLDSNTPRHVAHSLVDLSLESQESRDLQTHIFAYRDNLAGGSGIPNRQIEDEYYFPIGIGFLLENIKWDKIEDPQVLKLYKTRRRRRRRRR